MNKAESEKIIIEKMKELIDIIWDSVFEGYESGYVDILKPKDIDKNIEKE